MSQPRARTRSKRLEDVRAEMSFHILADNMRRAINILGVPAIVAALEVS